MLWYDCPYAVGVFGLYVNQQIMQNLSSEAQRHFHAAESKDLEVP